VSDFIAIERGTAPLVVSIPHAGTDIPADIETRLVSPWLARKDADWYVEQLYAFAADAGATIVRTTLSRTVIDVNRDPSGASLYPGQATTGLCPLTTFDGEPLYRAGQEPDEAEIAERRARYFDPYHTALSGEIFRLRAEYPNVVLYEAHSIRGEIPRLFEGPLPDLNIGTNSGASCAEQLIGAVAAECARSPFSKVVNGRFQGGWTTRQYGRPEQGIHALQMELACRTYLDEPPRPSPDNWPPPYDDARAAALREVLRRVIGRCIEFAKDLS
jgi:N-formylglutamate deformylase